MKLLFRVDASQKIGTGHVMRCLTLANQAYQKGWRSHFVLRDPEANIVKIVALFDHQVTELFSSNHTQNKSVNNTVHSDWLPVSQVQDAHETVNIIQGFSPDWIIVDHYALDATWLSIVKKCTAKIFVLDDLGDRDLICDLLLDQNLGASIDKYAGKVPRNCRLLLGPSFALLRSEFREWREQSLNRRFHRNIENILINMGGVDAKNYTLRVLKEITKSKYAKSCTFTVVTGGSYPHIDTLNEFVNLSKFKVLVSSNVKNMAEIMSKSDLCIGAAGSTSWERCCLGQPTITFSIADNQREIANQLSKRNVAIYSNTSNLLEDFEQFFDVSGRELLKALSANSSLICDGFGASRVIEELEKKFEN